MSVTYCHFISKHWGKNIMSNPPEDDDARRYRPRPRLGTSGSAATRAAISARSHRVGGPIIAMRHIAMILLFLAASARDNDVRGPSPAAEAFSIIASPVGSPAARTGARNSRTAVLGATAGSSSSPTTTATAPTRAAAAAGRRMRINEDHPGLRLLHADPDVYVIEGFLDGGACDDLIRAAEEKGTSRSPVAYAGWTDDLRDLVGLAASGPVAWIALFGAWWEARGGDGGPSYSVATLVAHALRNYAAAFVLAVAAISAFIKSRADGLGELRTSTSTTLGDLSRRGAREFALRASELFDPARSSSPSQSRTSTTAAAAEALHPASYFEAPTVIRYETGQALAPHFDANRSADVEDAHRGGQTLSTLIVYLNDVPNGGTTRFPRLPPAAGAGHKRHQVGGADCLEIVPRRGDALLFFPADECGNFDERTEHEGRPAVDGKWIARIWRHARCVPPPFGLSDELIRDHL
jgi:hypothetical protein